MKVNTYLFGEVEVNPDTVITFPKGLIGFAQQQRYFLVHETDQDDVTSFTLQSIDEPTLAFQIIDPSTLGYSYELLLSDEENELLCSPAVDQVAVMQVLMKNEEGVGTKVSPNLRAPLLINTQARVGIQKAMETFRPNIVLSNLVSSV